MQTTKRNPCANFDRIIYTSFHPPAKPPRRSVAHSPGGGVYEQLCLASSGGPRRRRLSSGDSRSSAEYVDMRPNAAPGTQPPAHLDNHSDASSRLCELSSLYDQQGNRSSSSSSGSKRATVQIPLSPSHYEQPPTPEFPPPSPATAESGIHSKIRPLSRQQRRRRLGSDGSSSRRSSRDVDTLTDEDELLLELNGDAAPTPTLVSSTTTTTTTSGIVEEIVEENPFADPNSTNCRGHSTTKCNLLYSSTMERRSLTRSKTQFGVSTPQRGCYEVEQCLSEASSRPNSEPLSPVFGDQGGRRDASGASFSTAAREEEEEVCKGPRRRREMLTTPGSFGGRLGDLGCWRCELAGWLAGSGVTGAADSDSSCLDGAAAAASRLPPKPPRFSPRAAACLRGHNSRGRARISSCNGGLRRTAPRRSRPCTCLPSTTSAWCSSAGVRDLFPASTRDRPAVLLSRLQSGVLPADRRPNGPRRAAESSSRFITAAPARVFFHRLTSPVISVGLGSH
ncbi:hypothetical protein HPB48_016612 [Haemaphysalis longicornis]|uniref:Uncharacterized protein n=1 Tax=Haemaphysalis longicornis TaxID=44386 RepID=A0A9J6GEU6_HAELO|nr:hypothetical protein HPB48_016612 [Haemaphysalis longicornis]